MQSSLRSHVRDLQASFGVRVVLSTNASSLQQMYASTVVDDLPSRCQSLSDRLFIAGRESDADRLSLLTEELFSASSTASSEGVLCMLATLLACAQRVECADKQKRDEINQGTDTILGAIDLDQLHWHDVTVDYSDSDDEITMNKLITETPRVYKKQCNIQLKRRKPDVFTHISTRAKLASEEQGLYEAISCMLLGEPSIYFQIEFGRFECPEEPVNARGAVRSIMLEFCDLATHIKKLEILGLITNADSFVQEIQAVLIEAVSQFQNEVVNLQLAADSTMTLLQYLRDIHSQTCLDELLSLELHTLDNEHDMVELCDKLQTHASGSIIACKLIRTLMRGYIHQCCDSMSGVETRSRQVLPRCLLAYKELFDTIGNTSKSLASETNLVQFGRAIHCAGNACLASWTGSNDPISIHRFSKNCEEQHRLRLAEVLVRTPLSPIYPFDLIRILAIELDNLWAGHIVSDMGLNLALSRTGHKFHITCSELTDLGLIETISVLQESGEDQDYSKYEPSIKVFRRLLRMECLIRGLRSVPRQSRGLHVRPTMQRSWQILEILLVMQSHMYAQLDNITVDSARLVANISTLDEVRKAHQKLTVASEDALFVSAAHKAIKRVLNEVYTTTEQYVRSALGDNSQTEIGHYRSILDNVRFMTRILEKDPEYILFAKRLQYASM